MRIVLIFIMCLIATYSEAQIWDNYMKAINEINNRPTSPTMFNNNIVVEKSAPTYYNNSYNNVVGNNIIIDSKPIIIQQNSIPSVIQIHRELEEMERRIKLNKLK